MVGVVGAAGVGVVGVSTTGVVGVVGVVGCVTTGVTGSGVGETGAAPQPVKLNDRTKAATIYLNISLYFYEW